MRRRSFSVLVLTLLAACSDAIDDRTAVEPSTGLRFLGGETGDGFARATAPRRFVFPADHGSHPDYRTEWWYFTGNLADGDGPSLRLRADILSLCAGATCEVAR